MLKELYERIQQLERDLASFDETAATDEVRFQFYPKKALLAETYYELGQHLEKVQPLESVYCYWKSFVLENDSSIGCRLFGGVKNQLMDDPHDPEEIPSFLEHSSSEMKEFLKAMQYWLGIGEAQSYENAFQKLKGLGNHPDAIYMQGMMYKLGYFVKENGGEAVRWFQMAADQGNAAAQKDLGVMCGEGCGGLDRNDGEAVRLYRLAVHQGNAVAQNNLGVMCERGLGGLKTNDSEAVRLYRLAAAQGVAVAQNNLGLMCAEGRGGLDRNDGEAVRLFRLAAWRGEPKAQRNLIALYNKEDASIPIGPQEIKYFFLDISLSSEIKEAVSSYLRKRLLENDENFEVVYCVYRILLPESAMDEILKRVPPKETFEFVMDDSSISIEERGQYFLTMLLFFTRRRASSDEEQEAKFNGVCEYIGRFVAEDKQSEPVQYEMIQGLINEVTQSIFLYPSDKRKIWSLLLKKLGHGASSVFLENENVASYCIYNEDGYFLYQRLIGYFEKDESFKRKFQIKLLNEAAQNFAPLENTLVFSRYFRDVPVEMFLELLGRPLVCKFIGESSDINFENLMLILERFPDLNDPSFLDLYPLLLLRLRTRWGGNGIEEDKSEIRIIANYFLRQSQDPQNAEIFRKIPVDFLQSYFRALYTGVYPKNEIQRYIEILMKAYLALGNEESNELFQWVRSEITKLVEYDKITTAPKINLLCFLYQNGRQIGVKRSVVSEIRRLKLDVSLIETDREEKTPVSKILLLLDLIVTSIFEEQDKPVENICSGILASHYLDEIDRELKKWSSMIPKTLSQEERGGLEKSIQEILQHCKVFDIDKFIQKAQKEAQTGSKRWFFMQTAAQQFLGRFEPLQRLSLADIWIEPEQQESPNFQGATSSLK